MVNELVIIGLSIAIGWILGWVYTTQRKKMKICRKCNKIIGFWEWFNHWGKCIDCYYHLEWGNL